MNKELNKYRRLFFKVILLLIIIGIADQVVGNLLRHYYFKQMSGLHYRTTYAIDSTRADMLIFGSSRADHHYVPDVFEDSLHLSCYNTGRDGNYILFNYAVFKSILQRYTPRLILFDISPEELYYDAAGYDHLSSLLPYYRSHPEIRATVELRSPFERVKLISSIYPFNSCLSNIIIGNMELNKARKMDRKGFTPLTHQITDSLMRKIDLSGGSVDTNLMNSVLDIIQLCKRNNIRLIFIQSPIFGLVQPAKDSEMVENLADMNGVTCWNYFNDPDFLSKPRYFQDPYHLNEEGAIFFSGRVAKRLKENRLTAILDK